jgi:uncharacterized membrane protein
MSDPVTPTDPPPVDRGAITRACDTVTAWDPYIGPQVAVAAAILLDLALPEKVTIGPAWLLPSLEALLLVALVVITPRTGLRHSPARRNFAMALIGLVSAANIASLVLLSDQLLRGGHHDATGHRLLLAGIVLWGTNVLLFGVWFWELDRDGPLARRVAPGKPDFLFPQMAEPRIDPGWEPNLIDYLYVSFTNATAFSPTDTMPLSRVAKLLMATQSLVALVTIGLVVARAVNILA